MPQAVSDVLVAPSAADAAAAIPIHLLAAGPQALAAQDAAVQAYAALNDFKAEAGQVLTVPDGAGGIGRVLAGVGAGGAAEVMALRALPARLPAGDYGFAAPPADLNPDLDLAQATLAFALGSYAFDRYKAEHARPRARLVIGGAVDLAAVERIAHACALARDMVNTPPNDMGPLQIETIAREIAKAHGASISVVEGEALLEANYPAVHAVGRAAAPHRQPRMIEIGWRGPGAEPQAPLVALVGKGVAFDTGGLDIKPSAGMRNMKKDMGGAAHALALARMVMGAALPIRLAVLIPAVENAISGDAIRPGDVIGSRAGLSIEIGNTDAEGRLILADALTRAGELSPDLTIDLATLTGAARAALGPDLPPVFSDDEALAVELLAAAAAVADPLWRLPLWPGYAEALKSDVADLKNDPDAWAQAGAVTAALFLKRFAPKTGAWAHLDIFAWNPRARPGWPAGGEAQAIRALFRLLQDRYGAETPA